MSVRNLLPLLFTLVFHGFLSAQVTSIAATRDLPAGSNITVRGIVTNGSELGKIRYFQDGTAGIGAYPGTGSAAGFETAVHAGDSIEVSGTLIDYHDLLEINPITNYTVISSGHPQPAPRSLTLARATTAPTPCSPDTA